MNLDQAPSPPVPCEECGAAQPTGRTCEDDFHEMLAWEYERPTLWAVHHLMVLCFHLQHPSRYSKEGLAHGVRMLAHSLEEGLTAEELRMRNRSEVDSSRRTWKIKETPESQGRYPSPIIWPLTARDVVRVGIEDYCQSVRRWAELTLMQLYASGNQSLLVG